MKERTLVISVDTDRFFEVTEEDQENFPFLAIAYNFSLSGIADERSNKKVAA